MNFKELETPALLIDKEIMVDNLNFMQNYANKQGVYLKPHTKTHKMPRLAKMQEELGARGISVAKVGEAEVMAESGLKDIFIANQIVGKSKIKRIRKLSETINITVGIDNIYQVNEINEVFTGAKNKAQVLVEIEVGEERSGIIKEIDFQNLLKEIKKCENVSFKGIFSHDGHSYAAENLQEVEDIYIKSTERTLKFRKLAVDMGMDPEIVSIGSTPSLMLGFNIPKGVTEIRPGTYILMDGSQANVIGTTSRCAATILTTVISKPTKERVVTDVGAKGLTTQRRTKGLVKTAGLGLIKEYKDVHIFDVYDEHALIYNEKFRNEVKIGEKLRIIPNHICPVVNLYENAYLIEEENVLEEIPVACKGKMQ